MNIYDFAIDFERENREFYEKCAAESASDDLKQVFLDLADEERKHEEIVKQLKAEKKVDEVEAGIMPKAKKAFEKISKDIPEGVLPKEQVNVYKQAKEMETKSYEFYTEKAEESDL